jgi:shikimate dehydrogenase
VTTSTSRPVAATPSAGTACLGFVGVSTGGSSIHTVFPEWADELGLPARTLVGHDVPMDAAPEEYRRVVETIRDDPAHHGALVTTHKVAVFAAAGDMFDELDAAARTFGEVSCLTKRDGRLLGSAKDPVTARLALADFLADDHFSAYGAEALVLGAGGAGLALSHELGHRADRPGRITCTDTSADRLDQARRLHQRAGLPADLFSYVQTPDQPATDALVAALPPGSLVVNATGMGKDRPGSPVSDSVVFPDQARVWEFNYRGSLNFWHQAVGQRDARRLHVEDGWRYFIHGWTQAIAEVFNIPMPADRVEVLARIAARVRR